MQKISKERKTSRNPDHYLILANSKRYRQCIQETCLEVKYFERGLSKILQKFKFIFGLEPSLFL